VKYRVRLKRMRNRATRLEDGSVCTSAHQHFDFGRPEPTESSASMSANPLISPKTKSTQRLLKTSSVYLGPHRTASSRALRCVHCA
jgi:hypothetical protein